MSQTNALIGLALLLNLVAVAIALLLRPVNKQLRLLVQAATAIAAGDFSVRVDERKASSARTLARAFNDMADRIAVAYSTRSAPNGVPRIAHAPDLSLDKKMLQDVVSGKLLGPIVDVR